MMDTPRENSTHDSGVWLLDRIMNQMNAGVYITDVDTDEILFMNSGMKKQFGLVEPEGKICWQVLQKGMSGRCPFCPVPRLLRDGPSAAPLRWEEHNTSNGCIYENFDSLIQWHDGRLVHFQHSLNVTEYHKLSIAATTDELTGALNRRAGKAALAEMAAACARTGEPFSLCMFDVNDLKKTNDHFGHAAGDQLLVSIAEAVRGVLQEGDVLVLAGSIPASMPDDIYRNILKRLDGKGILIAVDATGNLLVNVLEYHPFLVKPNNHELGEIFGVELKDRESVIPYAKKMQEMGATNVLVSMAGEGAVLAAADGKVYLAPAPKGKLDNGVGAGDSMVAGFLTGWLKRQDYREAFHMGIATGSASAFSEYLAGREQVEDVYRQVNSEVR